MQVGASRARHRVAVGGGTITAGLRGSLGKERKRRLGFGVRALGVTSLGGVGVSGALPWGLRLRGGGT